jgi:hypothetical protein
MMSLAALDAEVLALVKSGKRTLREIVSVLPVDALPRARPTSPADRIVDRSLQRLRKARDVVYDGRAKGWRARR